VIVQPWPLDDAARTALAPSMGALTWQEVEGWLSDCVACVWRIGDEAYVLTFANADDEIEIVAAGGRGAIRAAAPFEAAMRAIPQHKGLTLRIDGRKGWRRFYGHWDCDDQGVLTTRM